MKRTIVMLLIAISFLQAQNTLPKDPAGWTVFAPSDDTRIIYVSATDGNDATAVYYTKNDPLIGPDPFQPQGAIKPFSTISAAFDASRAEQPDWILLKRGDVFTRGVPVRSGRSASEPFLVSSYGNAQERPLLKTGAEAGVNVCCKDHHYIAVAGLDFYAHTRNPASPDYAGPAGSTGFNFYTGENYTGTGVLVENCRFRFYKNNVVQGPGTIEDVVIRRNQILDNYSTDSHSQGMYTKNVKLLLEENLFDHNGWFMQQIDGGSDQDSGQATMFNHNTYFTNAQGVTFRGNLFLRASSIGNKWTANDGPASARDIVIDNNLYLEGEIGMSIGGNETDPPHRFQNVTVINNVLLDIGRARPTNRSLGWYLDINDWDNGTVAHNLFLHQASQEVGNVYAINVQGETRNVAIRNNTMHGLRTNGSLVLLNDGTVKESISFENNILQCPGLDAGLVDVRDSKDHYSFAGNVYFSGRQADEWFRLIGSRIGMADWISGTGEIDPQASQVTFPDPQRTLETYHASLGKPGTLDAFIAEARNQSKADWNPAYTAAAINNWIRAGFDMSLLDVKLPGRQARKSMVYGGKTFKAYRLDGKEMHNWQSETPSQRAYSPGGYIECFGISGFSDCQIKLKTGD